MGSHKSKELSLSSSTINTTPTNNVKNSKQVSLPIPRWSPSNTTYESLQSITPIKINEHNDKIIKSPSSVHPICNSDTYTNNKFTFGSDLTLQISDCWNMYHPQQFAISSDESIPNTIHRIFTNDNNKASTNNQWISVFGTQIIHNSQYKVWDLKIYPRFNMINNIDFGIADIVVGICDVNTVRDEVNGRYNKYQGGFWLSPYFGYAYYGYNGKKFHLQYRGKNYGQKYKIYDIIRVELDMQVNALRFCVNDMNQDIAYYVEDDRDYVLAVAFCNDNYEIQIC